VNEEDFLKNFYCTDIDEKLVGKKAELYGWVQIKREHGGVIFVDLRDRSGIVQLVFNENFNKQCFEVAAEIKAEYVIQIAGEVRRRENPNPELPTGEYEIWVLNIVILNDSKTPPIGVIKQSNVSEELRLQYRYIDLRRQQMHDNIMMRHNIVGSVRTYLNAKGFIDIETPFLTKSTPEGARDFLVPSRLNSGKFYALPQSPQIFKQLLMVSGFEKYYQIVRCFRDEDLRADRQPEFTQIDIEASFIVEEDIYNLVDGMFKCILEDCYGKTLETPVRRFDYNNAVELYGTDRPDLRIKQNILNLDSMSKMKPVAFLRDEMKNGKYLYGIIFPGPEKLSRKLLDIYAENAHKAGVEVFTWLKVHQGNQSGPFAKLFETTIIDELRFLTEEEDFVLVAALGTRWKVLPFLGGLRVQIADTVNVIERDKLKFCWIVNFPLFEWSDDENKMVSVHHPFTSPRDEDVDILEKEPLKVKSRSYDFVLNGIELGGGSIRIHKRNLQNRIFYLLGLNEEETEEKFGFLLKALDFGAPPHGGIAFGLDRIVMMLQNEASIREVIPFPKTTKGTCPLTGAPDSISEKQLLDLGISLKQSML
jgi:aspartyl-tRNA synthetase